MVGRLRPRARRHPRGRATRHRGARGRRRRAVARCDRAGEVGHVIGATFRPTEVEIDLGAIRHNVGMLRPAEGQLMAVVKADAYGHGAASVAREALVAGATWCGVALVEEGVELRAAGIEAPILVLSEFPPGSEAVALAHRLTPTVYSPGGVERLAAASGRPRTSRRSSGRSPTPGWRSRASGATSRRARTTPRPPPRSSPGSRP